MRKVSAVSIILSIRLLLGFYYNISHSIYVRYVFKLYCTLLCLGLTYLYCIKDIFKKPIFTIEYIVYSLFSSFSGHEFVFKYLNDIKICDAVMGFKEIPFYNNEMVIFMIIAFICRLFIISLSRFGFFSAINIIILAVDTNHIIPALIFLPLYIRMKMIKSCMQNNIVPVNIVQKYELKRYMVVVRKCLIYYNNLLESMKNVDNYLQFMVRNLFKIHFCF